MVAARKTQRGAERRGEGCNRQRYREWEMEMEMEGERERQRDWEGGGEQEGWRA